MTVHPAAGSATTTSTGSVKAGTATATTGTNTGKTTTTTTTGTQTTGVVQRSYAPADLSVRVVSQYVDQYGNGTVTFDIANIGGTRSSSYYFTAQLPTSNVAPYTSSIQASLAPGSHIADTLHFTQAESGTFTVAVHAYDRNQSNNYASQWVNAPVTYNSYNYNSNNSYNSGNYYSQPTNYQYQSQFQY
jgi:hypothetical protein